MDEQLISSALTRLLMGVERQRLAASGRLGLAPMDLLGLSHIAVSGEISPGRLARQLVLSSSGTTALVQRLVAAGLVDRMPSSAAGSRISIRVTPRGRELLAQLSAPLDAAVTAVLSREVPEPAAKSVERLLLSLADAVEREADRATTGASEAADKAGAVPLPVRWG